MIFIIVSSILMPSGCVSDVLCIFPGIYLAKNFAYISQSQITMFVFEVFMFRAMYFTDNLYVCGIRKDADYLCF